MDIEELKRNLTSGQHWLRLLFMVLFALILYVAAFVMAIVVVLQFLFSLITGQDNSNLRRFGHSLAQYIYQTLCFLTYSREDKPFPFDDWPTAEHSVPVAPVAEPRPSAAKSSSATGVAAESAAGRKTTVKRTTVKSTTAKKGPVTESETTVKDAAETTTEQAPLPEETPQDPTEKPNI